MERSDPKSTSRTRNPAEIKPKVCHLPDDTYRTFHSNQNVPIQLLAKWHNLDLEGMKVNAGSGSFVETYADPKH
jgi:hypothetical protein